MSAQFLQLNHVTSYFFVEPPKKQTVLSKYEDRKVTHVLVNTAHTCERQVNAGMSVVWDNQTAVIAVTLQSSRKDTKDVISSLTEVFIYLFVFC